MTYESNSIDAVAALEATNATLREVLSFQNSHIAMLEERLFNMSVELASSRAREDEQNLKSRQSTEVPQSSTISEDDDFMIPVDLVDDSIRSAPTSSSNRHPLFSFMPGWGFSRMSEDDANDGTRSLGSGAGGVIGKMIRFDRSEDLRVDFPTGGRRSMMDEYSAATDNSTAHHQRRTVVGQLFRSRISSLTVDDMAEESYEHEGPMHQKMNPKMLRHQVSSRVLGSTVLFPREDDDYSLGFE
eukprot:scaffold2246_cov179-Skeletonema_menzelii.AAC.1